MFYSCQHQGITLRRDHERSASVTWRANPCSRRLPASSSSSESPKSFDAPLSWRSAMSAQHTWLREKHYWFFFSFQMIAKSQKTTESVEKPGSNSRVVEQGHRSVLPWWPGLNVMETEQQHRCWYDCCSFSQLWLHNHHVSNRKALRFPESLVLPVEGKALWELMKGGGSPSFRWERRGFLFLHLSIHPWLEVCGSVC